MAKPGKARSPAEWADILHEQAASGMSVKKWCQQDGRGISPSSIYTWRSKLEDGSWQEPKTRKPSRGVGKASQPQADTSGLRVALGVDHSVPSGNHTVVVYLDDYAAFLVVDDDTDLGLLRRTLQALAPSPAAKSAPGAA